MRSCQLSLEILVLVVLFSKSSFFENLNTHIWTMDIDRYAVWKWNALKFR